MAHTFKINIEYEDIDTCHVVYHPNYLKYVDRARNDMFNQYGYFYPDQFSDGVGFAIVSIQSNYVKSILLSEEVTVRTNLEKVGKTSIVLNHLITSQNEDDIRFEAKYVLVFVDWNTRTKIVLSEKTLKMLKSIPSI